MLILRRQPNAFLLFSVQSFFFLYFTFRISDIINSLSKRDKLSLLNVQKTNRYSVRFNTVSSLEVAIVRCVDITATHSIASVCIPIQSNLDYCSKMLNLKLFGRGCPLSAQPQKWQKLYQSNWHIYRNWSTGFGLLIRGYKLSLQSNQINSYIFYTKIRTMSDTIISSLLYLAWK